MEDQDVDNAVENTDEISGQENSAPVEESQGNSEESDVNQEAKPQDGVGEGTEPGKSKTSKEPAVKPKAKFKTAHVPYYRFAEVNSKYRALQKEIEAMKAQLPNVQAPAPQPNLVQQIADQVIERQMQAERLSRADEAIAWLGGKVEELKKEGLERPSLEAELQDIIDNSGWEINKYDPMDILQAAYEIWKKDNIEEVASAPAETPNQSGNTEVESSKQPTAADVRNAQKAKATGVSKARTSKNTKTTVEYFDDDDVHPSWQAYPTTPTTRAGMMD